MLPYSRFPALLSLLLLSGCGENLGPSVQILEAMLHGAPHAHTPLVGQLIVDASEPASLTVEVSGGGENWSIPFDVPAGESSHPILGLLADTEYTVTATAENAVGDMQHLDVGSLTTAPLPAGVPTFSVTSSPVAMEPGLTFFNLKPTLVGNGGFLVAVDSDGDIVWLHHDDESRPGDARRIANGNILFLSTDRLRAIEMNMLGDVVRTYFAGARNPAPAHAVEVDVASLHHEIFEMDNGNLLALSTEARQYSGYPTSELDPTPQASQVDVVGDVIVEFQTDGTIVGEWSLLDLLDPYRVNYSTFTEFWSVFYDELSGTIDWSHANAVIHDPTDDTFIVSARTLDAMVKFDRMGNLVWILGDPAGWTVPWDAALLAPSGMGFAYAYHAHAPTITPDGNLLLFDNVSFGAVAPSPALGTYASRAVEYTIDEMTMEVRQSWEYGSGGELGACAIVGDADALPSTDNVLTVCGALDGAGGATPHAVVVEVTRDEPATEVFRLEVEGSNLMRGGTPTIYRAERIHSLYP